MNIGVSIVSYNTKELLNELIKNLQSAKLRNNLEIWVVDNNSNDGSAQMLDNLEGIQLIKNHQNLGFAKAQNQILKEIKTDFSLILNPDTKFDPKGIDQMVAFMEKNPSCGIASCKLVGFDGKLQSNGGDLPYGLALWSWLFNLESIGIKQNFHRMDYINKEVGWVGGTFMMVRKGVFEKIGYFDEDYFMYFEDVEFCIRAKDKGFKVMINPEVEVKHKSGASSKNPTLRQFSGEYWGIIHFYNKKFGYFVGALIKLLIIKSILLRMLAFFILGKINNAKTYAYVITKI